MALLTPWVVWGASLPCLAWNSPLPPDGIWWARASTLAEAAVSGAFLTCSAWEPDMFAVGAVRLDDLASIKRGWGGY